MGKLIVVIILTLLSVSRSNSQVTQEWSQRYNGPVNEFDGVRKMAVDNSGNVYITGDSKGAGTDYDFCTIKYNSSGAQQWVQRYNGTGNGVDYPNSIAVDKSGNVYVTGISLGNDSGNDFLTIKYNSTGVQQWVQRYNYSSGDDAAYDIALDTSGNVYVTGKSGTTAVSSDDYTTIKYNSAGIQQWVKRYNGPGNLNDVAFGLVVDASGNVYVTGSSAGSSLSFDYLTLKYNSAGVQQWEKRFNGSFSNFDAAYAIKLDYSGNIYVTGAATGLGTLKDFLTIKYNALGTQVWARTYDAISHKDDYGTSLAVDSVGNVFVTGISAAANGTFDFLTICYNSAGEPEVWTKRYNGAANNDDFANDVKIDKNNNVYITGQSTVNGSSTNCVTIKYSSNGTQLWIQEYNGLANGNDKGTSLAVDNSGNVYVGAASEGTDTYFDFATIKYSQSIGIQTLSNEIPNRFFLSQNYPNPFNPTTNIKFDVMKSGIVSIKVFDIVGKEIQELLKEFKPVGSYQITFDGSTFSSGVYFYEMQTNDFVETKRMLLVK